MKKFLSIMFGMALLSSTGIASAYTVWWHDLYDPLNILLDDQNTSISYTHDIIDPNPSWGLHYQTPRDHVHGGTLNITTSIYLLILPTVQYAGKTLLFTKF